MKRTAHPWEFDVAKSMVASSIASHHCAFRDHALLGLVDAVTDEIYIRCDRICHLASQIVVG
ncbi:hypothetical protein TP49_19835 [Xanthomonas citri pv. aurantifolii]|nr:hypothetical protein TP50_17120 [Xanthomonas citri pv. aurantifolii]TBW94143.1 hypothetical protein TP49_19835 [Xanthomonas citri pv. aurantifolii]